MKIQLRSMYKSILARFGFNTFNNKLKEINNKQRVKRWADRKIYGNGRPVKIKYTTSNRGKFFKSDDRKGSTTFVSRSLAAVLINNNEAVLIDK